MHSFIPKYGQKQCDFRLARREGQTEDEVEGARRRGGTPQFTSLPANERGTDRAGEKDGRRLGRPSSSFLRSTSHSMRPVLQSMFGAVERGDKWAGIEMRRRNGEKRERGTLGLARSSVTRGHN